MAARAPSLASPLIASSVVHVAAILAFSAFVGGRSDLAQNFVPIGLVDLPRAAPVKVEPVKTVKTEQPARVEVKKPVVEKPAPPPPAKVEEAKETDPIVKAEAEPEPVAPAAPAPAIPKQEPLKSIEAPPAVAASSAEAPAFSAGARGEGGGSEAGAGNLFGQGDVAVVPGSGAAGGGGGTAAAGLGRGAGAPGLPGPTTVLKTNREAKPLQTVRASYPPMALRMGVEGDVTLRIEVDARGRVTKADLLKAAGMGFDEEALRAVKQSRFEPAQKDGRNVPAEFTYIYRFRLAK